MSTLTVARSVALFVLAGVMEIGGGYLVWLWLREHRWWLDGHRPDAPDVAGALLCVVGVAVIMYWPRAAGA